MASYTWKAVGNKEDISDVIINISPEETFLINRFGKTTATAINHYWLHDSIRPAQANKHLEKADFTTVEATPRRRAGNYIQHFMHGYVATDAQEAVLKHGIKSELGYQMVKASKEIARDIELAVLKNATSNRGASNSPGNEGVMGGVRYFVGGDAKQFTAVAATDVCTLVSHGFFTGDLVSIYATGAGVLPAGLSKDKIYYVRAIDADTFTVHLTSIDAQANANKVDITSAGTAPFFVSISNICAASAVEGGAKTNLVEQVFNDMVQKIWSQGATVDSAVMSGKNKRTISGWTAGATKNREQSDRKLTTVIEVFESDFGIVNLEAHRMQDDDRIDFFEYQYYKLAYLKPLHVENVPRKGTYTEKVIDGMLTVECKSPNSQGAIIGLVHI